MYSIYTRIAYPGRSTITVKFATSPLVLPGRCAGVNSMLIWSKKRAAPADAEASAVGQRGG